MKIINKTFLSFLLLYLIVSCNDNLIESENNDGKFRFEVNVKDNNSNSLPDVEIYVWNKILIQTSFLQKQLSVNEVQSSTIIRFDIPQTSIVELNVYDVENNLYESLIKNEILNAGYYKVVFHHPNDIGSAIYKCQITARIDSLSNDIFYKDSIYAVMIAPYVQIGTTNHSGSFTTDKKVMFPSLYELPTFVFTSEASEESIGFFELLSEIIVALTNNSSETKYYEKTITDGENVLNLIWEEGSDEVPDWGRKAAFNKKGIFNKIKDDSTMIPNEYRLYQNYPNPFN